MAPPPPSFPLPPSSASILRPAAHVRLQLWPRRASRGSCFLRARLSQGRAIPAAAAAAAAATAAAAVAAAVPTHRAGGGLQTEDAAAARTATRSQQACRGRVRGLGQRRQGSQPLRRPLSPHPHHPPRAWGGGTREALRTGCRPFRTSGRRRAARGRPPGVTKLRPRPKENGAGSPSRRFGPGGVKALARPPGAPQDAEPPPGPLGAPGCRQPLGRG